MHIHLDLLGGISGDMFIGAILDCFPDLAESLSDQLVKAGFKDMVKLAIAPANDGMLTGTKFNVITDDDATSHDHRHYSDIVKLLEQSSLDSASRNAALEMFRIIAEAEAAIHGEPLADIAFHEVGAWDSIADVVCTACLIASLDADRWSVSSLPIGGGRIETAHGSLPVPAPATALILEGFEFHDDGIAGERITPTGAAIIKYLSPTQTAHVDGKLMHCGYGFGTRKLTGTSNVTRAMVFQAAASPAWSTDRVLQLEFEIDDQTPEELAVALEQIRAINGVLDVLQTASFGKKGRQLASVRILAAPTAEQEVIRACFDETTTLGIRRQFVSRAILERIESTVRRGDARYRLKTAARPSATTVKVEMDDVATTQGGHAARQRIRQDIERGTHE